MLTKHGTHTIPVSTQRICDDPSYMPPIPDGTVLHDVSYEKESADRNGNITAAESWTPAISYENNDSFSSWKDIINNTTLDFGNVVSFRYGKNSNQCS